MRNRKNSRLWMFSIFRDSALMVLSVTHPLRWRKNSIGMAMACEEFGAKFFANGAAPGGVLEHPGILKMNPARVRDSWNATFGGSSNANKVAVLEEGVRPDGRH